jgi:hypothetical protein
MQRSTTFKVHNEETHDSIEATRNLTIPRVTTLANAGDGPSKQGNIIFNRADQIFYGHNGQEWAPLGNGGGGADDGFQATDESGVLIVDNAASGIETTGVDAVAGGNMAKATNDGAIALGSTVASGLQSISIGGELEFSPALPHVASGPLSVAIGSNSEASFIGSIAVGAQNLCNQFGSIAVGNANESTNTGSVVVGSNNFATGPGATTTGAQNTCSGDGALAYGFNNVVAGNVAIAIGSDHTAGVNGQFGGLTIGSRCTASGANSIAIGGFLTQAAGSDGVAIGSFASAEGNRSVGVGQDADATGQEAVCIGNDTRAPNLRGISIGKAAGDNGSGSDSICIGFDAAGTGECAIAIGCGSRASDNSIIAIGDGAGAGFGASSIAIGTNTNAAFGGIALGEGAVAAFPSGTNRPSAKMAITTNVATSTGSMAAGTISVPSDAATLVQVNIGGTDYYLALYNVA